MRATSAKGWLLASAGLVAVLCCVVPVRSALADRSEVNGTELGPDYAVGWHLAPAVLEDAVRMNIAVGFHDKEADPSDYENTTISVLSGLFAVSEEVSAFVHTSVASDTSRERGTTTRLGNPTIGGQYRRWLAPYWLADVSLAVTAPAGGGAALEDSSANELTAWAGRHGANEMFFGDYLSASPSLAITSTHFGGTTRGELGLQQFARVRGGTAEADAFETSASASVFIGSFLLPYFSMGAEARYQRWLSTPPFLARDDTKKLRDVISANLGFRVHIPLTRDLWLLPSLAYFASLRPSEEPLNQGIIIDVPVAF